MSDEIEFLTECMDHMDAQLTAMSNWLHEHQPDVWKRGLWGAMNAVGEVPARSASVQGAGWKPLTDVQWMNIVNHDHAWRGYSKDDAVHEAVKMTESKITEINAHLAVSTSATERNTVLEEALSELQSLRRSVQDDDKEFVILSLAMGKLRALKSPPLPSQEVMKEAGTLINEGSIRPSAEPASQRHSAPTPSFFVIVDASRHAEFVVNLAHEAQEHINDACEQGVEGAGKWKAVPVFEMRPTDDRLWHQTITDRDTYHDWADKLSEAIAKYFNDHIGEHSNMNCPWAEALRIIEEAEPLAASEASASPMPLVGDLSEQRKAMFQAFSECVSAESMLPQEIADRLLGAQPAAHGEEWQSMKTAPKDGTMLRLLVEFEDHATEDSLKACPTIGANNFDHDGIDEWKFAGWNWTHDCFTEGVGKPVAWMPLLAAPVPAPAPLAIPPNMREFVEAVATNYTSLDRQESLLCNGCGADLDDHEDHKPDCIVLRAQELLSPQGAENNNQGEQS